MPMQEMIDAGSDQEVLTTFRSLQSTAAELTSTMTADADMVAWVVSVSPHFTFIPTDFGRLLPRDRVNLVGSVSVGAGAAGGGEGSMEAPVNLLSAAAWDELNEKLRNAERENEQLECKAAAETELLKHKLAESERRIVQLRKRLKTSASSSST